MISIGWIDFSPAHRNKVGAALDLLKPEGMVDELGLGSIRDGIANQMFPGVSTIQTKAKYFFFVPYILYEYQKLFNTGQAKKKDPVKYLEQKEYELMWDLIDTYKGQFNSGVIGIRKTRGQKIVRRPSAIYWNGINQFGFLNSGGLSADLFLRKAKKGEFESLLSNISGSDEPSDDADADYENIFKLKVFPQPTWHQELSLDLSHDEADIFYNAILSRAKGKLTSTLLTDEDVWGIFLGSSNFMQFTETVQTKNIPDHLKEQLILAHDFSELMYGAHLTYNCLLQNSAFNNGLFEEQWTDWINTVSLKMLSYEDFDIEKLLTYSAQTREATIEFVRRWWHFVQFENKDVHRRNTLVEEQEFNVKRSKARIRYKKFDDIKEAKWVGFSYLDYRFRNVKTILNDIKNGLAQ